MIDNAKQPYFKEIVVVSKKINLSKWLEKIVDARKITEISPIQKLLLMIISTHLGDNEYCYLSIKTLQKEACLKNRSAVTENLNPLKWANIICVIPPGGKFKSNRYAINFNLLVSLKYQCSPLKGPEGSLKRTRGVSLKDPKKNIRLIKDKYKGENVIFLDQNKNKKTSDEYRQEIRKTCGIKEKDAV